jgi:outer membrane receptor protein involved in Fe transport
MKPESGARQRQVALGPAIIVVTLACAPLRAQEPDSTRSDSTARPLPSVAVIGSMFPAVSPGVGSGIPARTAVLSDRQLTGWHRRHLAYVLAGQPGISLYDDLGSPFKPTLVTRGFTASPVVGLPQGVSVFFDGVPVNEPDAGQVNFDLLPLDRVSHIEVLSGTATLLGPNSLGGAVNLVTPRGDGTPGAELEVAAGSFDSYSIDASGGGSAGRWHYYAGAGHDRERGWRQLTAARRTGGLANVGRFGERAGLGLQASWVGSRAETAGSLPQSVYSVRPDSNLSAGDFEDLTQLHVAVTGYSALPLGRASFNVFARRHGAERFNVNQVDDPDVRGFSRNRTLGATADWRTSGTVGAGTLAIRVGAGGQASRTAIRLYAERVDPGLTTDVESPIRKLDVFALADYQVGRVTLSGGARYDAVRVPFRNLLRPDRDTTSTFRRVSPRGGLSVDVARGISLYASVGESFRAPAVIELACADPEEPCPLPFALGDDPPLQPVVATTYEIGGRWARGALMANASAFRTNVRDDIFLFPYEDEDEPEGSTIDGFFGNVARTRREGVELGSSLLIAGGHALHATYAFTRAAFQSHTEIFSVREVAGEENEVVPGSRLPLVPAHTATVGGDVRLPAGFDLVMSARYTGARWLRGDEANETEPLSGYWVTDAKVGYIRGAWGVDAVVNNLFDREFATFGTFNINQGGGNVLERFLTPGEPRAAYVTLRRSFGTSRTSYR